MTIKRIFIFSVLLVLPWLGGGRHPAGMAIAATIIFAGVIERSIRVNSGRSRFMTSTLALPAFGMLALFAAIPSLYLHGRNEAVAWTIILIAAWHLLLDKNDKFIPARHMALFIVLPAVPAAIAAIMFSANFWPENFMPAWNFFGNRNLLGGFLVPALPFAAYAALRSASGMRRMTWFIFLCVCSIGIIATRSRGAFISAFAAMGIFFIHFLIYNSMPAKRKRLVAGLFVIGALAALSVAGRLVYRQYTSSDIDLYSFSRSGIWHASIKAIASKPLGYGAGSYRLAMLANNFPLSGTFARFGRWPARAHNEILQGFVESGPGFAMLAGFMILVLFRNMIAAWKKTDTYNGAATAALAGIFLHSLVDFNLHSPCIVFDTLIIAASIVQKPVILKRKRILIPVFVSITGLALFFFFKNAAGGIFHDMAVTFENTGKYEKALHSYEKAANTVSGNAQYAVDTAEFRQNIYGTKKSGITQKWWALAIEASPHDDSLYHGQGRFYLSLYQQTAAGRQKERAAAAALQSFTTAISLSPYNAVHYYYAFLACVLKGKIDSAAAMLDKAVNLEPNFIRAHKALGILFSQAADGAAAAGKTEKADAWRKLATRHNQLAQKSIIMARHSLLFTPYEKEIGQLP